MRSHSLHYERPLSFIRIHWPRSDPCFSTSPWVALSTLMFSPGADIVLPPLGGQRSPFFLPQLFFISLRHQGRSLQYAFPPQTRWAGGKPKKGLKTAEQAGETGDLLWEERGKNEVDQHAMIITDICSSFSRCLPLMEELCALYFFSFSSSAIDHISGSAGVKRPRASSSSCPCENGSSPRRERDFDGSSVSSCTLFPFPVTSSVMPEWVPILWWPRMFKLFSPGGTFAMRKTIFSSLASPWGFACFKSGSGVSPRIHLSYQGHRACVQGTAKAILKQAGKGRREFLFFTIHLAGKKKPFFPMFVPRDVGPFSILSFLSFCVWSLSWANICLSRSGDDGAELKDVISRALRLGRHACIASLLRVSQFGLVTD